MRILAGFLGLAGLAFFLPQMLLTNEAHADFMLRMHDLLGVTTVLRLQASGAGVLAALALLVCSLKSGGSKRSYNE
ncbi:hypothetical protein LBMAG49_15450 [Planctomycetota bacterium]|nr:hypothetical protein LBMAG49_15450 [Planctomycetota bacterium]